MLAMTTTTERKPAQLEMIGGKSSRQRIWELIRSSENKERFVGDFIIKYANVDECTYFTYIQCLLAGGYIELLQDGIRRQRVYRVIKDCGLEAPRLDRQGNPVKSGRGIEAVWRTMRMMDVLDVSILHSHVNAAGIDLAVSSIKSYVGALKRAGYLEVVMPATYNRMERVRLKANMNTGPRPPQIQKVKTVYDPNLNKVMFAEDPQEAL